MLKLKKIKKQRMTSNIYDKYGENSSRKIKKY